MHKALAFGLIAAIAIGACDSTPTPSPSPSSSPTPAPTSTPSPAARPIVVGLVAPYAPPMFYSMSNITTTPFRNPGERTDLVQQLVYNALYRYDNTFTAVPDLAARPCDVSGDGLTITCQLVDANFQNGQPMTADDVAFTYELARRDAECRFDFGAVCLGNMLASVRTLDPRTVEFRLKKPNATFLTLALPGISIDSRAVVEAAYAPVAERAATLDAAAYRTAAEAIVAAGAKDDATCLGTLKGTDELFREAALEPLPRDEFTSDGEFDGCMYAAETARLLGIIASSLGATGLDALSIIYPLLSFNRAPVGTGPFRFAGVEGGNRGEFDAFAGYFRGPPATPRIEVRLIRSTDEARKELQAGELTWMTVPLGNIFADVLPAAPGMTLASYPDASFTMLAYNLRKGRLFADPNLRAAMELCIDKPQTVDTAVGERGDVIYSPIPPYSWAYQNDLEHPVRNVEAARRLIQSSGWTPGKDGIYVLNGRRLAARVYVRSDDAARVSFMELVAQQVLDCGIDLTVVPADNRAVLGPLQTWPHIPAGQTQPFDAVFYGWQETYDPDDPLWDSRSISSKQQPDGINVMGFSDPHVDALLDEGLVSYDQRQRARIYRDLQDALAQDRPVLFGWAYRSFELVDDRLTSTDGPLKLQSRTWPWQIEKLVLPDH